MNVFHSTRNLYKSCVIVIITTIFLTFYIIENTYQKSIASPAIPFIINTLSNEKEVALEFINNTFDGEILIHFDLKGAPPKTQYILSLLPLLKNLGATGILIEYEDMFPYRNELEDIAAFNAYNLSEISIIIKEAEKYDFTVIPLVQTFGHFEFVLKLEQYMHLREEEDMPDILCPSHEETHPLLQKMIDQVLAAHPTAKYIHIGCDEVTTVGYCKRCQKEIINRRWIKKDIYFNHVQKVARYIKAKYPQVRPIMWGDELTGFTEKIAKRHNIAEFVDVMFWNYRPIKSYFPSNRDMKAYIKLFKSIWLASAFKGATGTDKIIPNPEYHLKNNELWMDLVKQYRNKIQFKGLVLTGWQRYNHFAVLCELFPVAIPSLSISMQFLKGRSDERGNGIKRILKCNDFVPQTSYHVTNKIMSLACDFPGFQIYKLIYEYAVKLQKIEKELLILKNPYLHFYSIANNFSYPRKMTQIPTGFDKYLKYVNSMEYKIRRALLEVYDEYTVTEWVMTYILPYQFRLEAASRIIKGILNQKTWPKRPFRNLEHTWRDFFNEFCNSSGLMGCNLLTSQLHNELL